MEDKLEQHSEGTQTAVELVAEKLHSWWDALRRTGSPETPCRKRIPRQKMA